MIVKQRLKLFAGHSKECDNICQSH